MRMAGNSIESCAVPEHWRERIIRLHRCLDADHGGTIDYSELQQIDKNGVIFEHLNATGDGDGEIDEEVMSSN